MMRIILILLLLLLSSASEAATLPVVNGVGATVQMNMVQAGDGSYSNRNAVCDGTNPTACAPVDTLKGLGVNVTGLIGQGTATLGQTGLIGMGAVTTAAPTYTTGQSNAISLDANGNLRTISLGNFATSTDAIGTSPGLGGSISFLTAFNGTSWDRLRIDNAHNLQVNCTAGCVSGTSSNAFDAQVTSSTNGQNNEWLYAFNGSTWDRLRDDGSFNLKVNCAVGCTGGSLSNGADAVATSSTNGGAIGFNYAFNGTTWDRLRDDGSFNLKVNLATPVPAGTNVIGHVISDAGSTVQLAAGANIAGKFTTDQTTPGTTDLVHAAPATAVANSADAVATSSSNYGTVGWNYGYNGTTWDRLQVDGSKSLKINCVTGCSGGTLSNAADAVATSSTNGQTLAFGYAFNGTTWDRLQDDGSKNLKINCVTGCSGGTSSNASSAVATSSTNGQQLAFNYAFNGTTWDQLQDDGSKNLKVIVNAPIAAGTNVIGHVIADSGSIVALNSGSNIVGKVTTDQTTPGTTDLIHDKPAQRTLVALDVSTVTTGGTAVTALSSGHRTAGGWLQNPIGATVNLCINEIGTASGTTSSGSTTCIQPGQTYTLIAAAGAVSVISSDSSHPFSGYGLQ
jgi:hypothetical protein